MGDVVKMSDVARRARVSVTTVSHVLNETRFVAPDTREAVLTAVREMGYVPNTVARSLADTLTGAYTLHFLPPGTYTVADRAVGYQVATQVVVVGPAQHVTGVNFTLVP